MVAAYLLAPGHFPPSSPARAPTSSPLPCCPTTASPPSCSTATTPRAGRGALPGSSRTPGARRTPRQRERAGSPRARLPAGDLPVGHVEPVPRRVRALLGRHDRARHDRGALRLGMAELSAVLRAAGRRRHPACWWTRGTSRAARSGPARRHGLRVGDVDPAGCGVGPAVRRTAGHRPLRLGRPRRLVRGGRAGLRPPAQSRTPGSTPCGRSGPCGSSSTGVLLAESSSPVLVFETGLPTRYYLPRTSLRLGGARAVGHRHRVPVQGPDQHLLVGAGRRHGCTATSRGPTTSRPASCCRSRGWSPSTTRRSTSPLDGRPLERPVTHFS